MSEKICIEFYHDCVNVAIYNQKKKEIVTVDITGGYGRVSIPLVLSTNKPVVENIQTLLQKEEFEYIIGEDALEVEEGYHSYWFEEVSHTSLYCSLFIYELYKKICEMYHDMVCETIYFIVTEEMLPYMKKTIKVLQSTYKQFENIQFRCLKIKDAIGGYAYDKKKQGEDIKKICYIEKNCFSSYEIEYRKEKMEINKEVYPLKIEQFQQIYVEYITSVLREQKDIADTTIYRNFYKQIPSLFTYYRKHKDAKIYCTFLYPPVSSMIVYKDIATKIEPLIEAFKMHLEEKDIYFFGGYNDCIFVNEILQEKGKVIEKGILEGAIFFLEHIEPRKKEIYFQKKTAYEYYVKSKNEKQLKILDKGIEQLEEIYLVVMEQEEEFHIYKKVEGKEEIVYTVKLEEGEEKPGLLCIRPMFGKEQLEWKYKFMKL